MERMAITRMIKSSPVARLRIGAPFDRVQTVTQVEQETALNLIFFLARFLWPIKSWPA